MHTSTHARKYNLYTLYTHRHTYTNIHMMFIHKNTFIFNCLSLLKMTLTIDYTSTFVVMLLLLFCLNEQLTVLVLLRHFLLPAMFSVSARSVSCVHTYIHTYVLIKNYSYDTPETHQIVPKAVQASKLLQMTTAWN